MDGSSSQAGSIGCRGNCGCSLMIPLVINTSQRSITHCLLPSMLPAGACHQMWPGSYPECSAGTKLHDLTIHHQSPWPASVTCTTPRPPQYLTDVETQRYVTSSSFQDHFPKGYVISIQIIKSGCVFFMGLGKHTLG